MASDANFVEYVRDQISKAGQVSVRKMFGEYAIYCDDKIIGLVCDNQFFVKPTTVGRTIMAQVVEAPPYPGAKPYFLMGEELDDREFMTNLIRRTASELPVPKPKKPKSKTTKK